MDLVATQSVQMFVDSGTAVQAYATADDDSGSAFATYTRNIVSNGATAVDIIEAPSSGTRRARWIEIANADTVTRVVSVRMSFNGTFRATKSWAVPAGKAIYWTPALGWQVPTTATQVGARPFETKVISSIGIDGGDPAAALYEMQRAGNVAATPTNIGTSIARCSLFRPRSDFTVDSIYMYGVGATTNVFRCAIYRFSDRARLTGENAFSTSVDTWGVVTSGINLALTAGELYFMATSVNATGTTAGPGCLGGTVAATTGRVNTAPASLPNNLSPSLGYVDSYYFQFAVTTGALPNPAAALAAQAAWTGGMPLYLLTAP